MSTTPFLRSYKLTVTTPVETGLTTLAILTDNQIQASIVFSSENESAGLDTQRISIYNANPEVVTALRTEGAIVTLQAGYHFDGVQVTEDNLPIIFTGEVVTSKSIPTGKDKITELTLASGYKALQTVPYSANFSDKTKLTVVIKSMCDALGMDSIIKLGKKEDYIVDGFKGIVSKKAAEALQALCNEFRLKWYVYLGEIYVVNGAEKDLVSFAALTKIPLSRVKGSVSFSTDGNTKNVEDTPAVNVEFNMFLYSGITLGSLISIPVNEDGEEIEGVYVVESLKYNLDLRGAEWDVRITATSRRS